MATERLQVIITENGSRVVKRNIEDIGRVSNSTHDAVEFMKRSLAGVAATLGIRQLIQYVDTYRNMQNRLRQVTTTQGQLAAVTKELFDISNRTRTAFESTSEIYARMAFASKNLGLSQKELLQISETLNQSVIAFGAHEQEARNALIQLSQAFSSGRLAGDEFRAVSEQMPGILDLIAKSLGVTRREILKMRDEQKLTLPVLIKALREGRVEMQERFAKVLPTIGQAFIVLRNRTIEWLGSVSEANGLIDKIAKSILFLAKNIDTLARSLVALASAFLLFKSLQGIILLSSVAARGLRTVLSLAVLVNDAIKLAPLISFRAVLASLGAAIGNPFAAMIAGLAIVTGLMIGFGDKIKVGKDNLVSLQDIAVATWTVFKRGIDDLRDQVRPLWQFFTNLLDTLLEIQSVGLKGLGLDLSFDTNLPDILDILGIFDRLGAGILASMNAVFEEIPLGGLKAFEALITAATSAWRAIVKVFEVGIDIIEAIVTKGVKRITDKFAPLKTIAEAIEKLDKGNIAKELISGALPPLPVIRTIQKPGQEKDFEAHGKSLAEAAVSGFQDGWAKGSTIGGLIQGIFDEASERAKRRMEENAKRQRDMALAQAQLGVPGPGGFPEDEAEKKKGRQRPTFADELRDLGQELSLLKLIGAERERAAKIMAIQEAIGHRLTAPQRAVADFIIRQIQAQERLNAVSEEFRDLQIEESVLSNRNAESREVFRDLLQLEVRIQGKLTEQQREEYLVRRQNIQALERQNQLLEEVQKPRGELLQRQEDLNELFDQGRITVEEFIEAVRKLEVEITSLDNSIAGGIANGLARMRAEMNNLGAVVSDWVVGSFQAATDAIVRFAETGKLEIRQLFAEIFAQLLRLSTFQLFSQLLSLGAGGVGVAGGGGFVDSPIPGLGGGGPIPTGAGVPNVGPASVPGLRTAATGREQELPKLEVETPKLPKLEVVELPKLEVAKENLPRLSVDAPKLPQLDVKPPELPKLKVQDRLPELQVEAPKLPKLEVVKLPKLEATENLPQLSVDVPQLPRLEPPQLPKLEAPEIPRLRVDVPEMPKLQVETPKLPKLSVDVPKQLLRQPPKLREVPGGDAMRSINARGAIRTPATGPPDLRLIRSAQERKDRAAEPKPPRQDVEKQPINVPIKIVNVDDPNKALESLSAPKGVRTIMNILRENRSELKQMVQG